MRFSIRLAIPLAMIVALASFVPTAQTQTTTPFTVDDLLDVKNAGIADLTDDGRWLAVTVASLRDRIGVDNYRFGDPTYIAPLQAEVVVIDVLRAAPVGQRGRLGQLHQRRPRDADLDD